MVIPGAYTTNYRTIVRDGERERWGYGHVTKPDARSNYTNRSTDDLIVVYPLRGRGWFSTTTDGPTPAQRRLVEPGVVLVHWPSTPCSLEVEPDGQWVEQWVLAPASVAVAMRALGVLRADVACLEPGVNDALAQSFARIGTTLRSIDDHDAEILGLRTHEWFVEAVRLARERPDERHEVEMVLAACRLLADGGGGSDAPIPRLAAQLGIGYELFRKVFRRRMGMAPGEYRIHRRIDRARELIMQHGLSNRQVAEELGYADPFVFSKQFKRITGESPTAFRRRSA